MPYIDKNSREKYKNITDEIWNTEIENKGDLEYLAFTLMQRYMLRREFRYSTLHEVVYAIMHCADEYRRRFLDKREDEAREINGDVK